MKLYYNRLVPSSAAATQEATGYPASNLTLESILRNWQSTSAIANDITLSYTAAQSVQALFIQDANFGSCTVSKSADGVTFTAVGTLTLHMDPYLGRYRGLIVINDPNVKAIKISIGAGTPNDGLTHWRIGDAPVMGSVSTLPRMTDYGFKVQPNFPMVSNTIPNGQLSQAATGPEYLMVTLPFNRKSNEDVFELLRRARAGSVVLDFGLSTQFPELVLPLKFKEAQAEENFASFNWNSSSIPLREVV